MTLKKLSIGFGLAFGLGVSVGVLTNCAAYVVPAGSGYSDDEDDYVYYPDYGVYYGARHHQYIYTDGSTWRRENAPNVSVDILAKSQSVPMTFHDAPEHHHSEIVGKYPGHHHDHP